MLIIIIFFFFAINIYWKTDISEAGTTYNSPNLRVDVIATYLTKNNSTIKSVIKKTNKHEIIPIKNITKKLCLNNL